MRAKSGRQTTGLRGVSVLERVPPLPSDRGAGKFVMNRDNTPKRLAPLVSLFRGLYTRVAQKLGVDTSYVSRVARGERNSDAVTAALSEEMQRIFTRVGNHNGNHHSGGTSRAAAKEKKSQKEEDANRTVAGAKKGKALPRVPESTRIEE
jgi:hypothetical protein